MIKSFRTAASTVSLLMIAAVGIAASAAGIDGKWVGMVGQSEISFTFKTEGGKLTGTLDNAAQPGATELKDVKLTGDTISFHVLRVLQESETKVEWTGKLAGDELKLQRGAVAGNEVAEVTAKRAAEAK